ncbi:MAG: hypothetical protein LBU05_05115 [Bifidobacteriaceae bacterium]|jgi:hypothetical protein|nr:hypothetical protein [Bifidobacteriaceae bacterium]
MIHSGAGRVVRPVMRPMTLVERGVTEPSVSFTELLSGARSGLRGATDFGLAQYAEEIVASGLPGIRRDPAGLRARQLDSYLDALRERAVPALGSEVRRPQALRAWLTAYAAATATTTAYTKILNAATAGDADKIAAQTAAAYRELLRRLWLFDPLPAWIPALNPLKRLAGSPRRHLVDPALAARLLGATISLWSPTTYRRRICEKAHSLARCSSL